jgi:hypothetical protein
MMTHRRLAVVPLVVQACSGGWASRGGRELAVAEANKISAASCDAGDADACGLLGMSMYLEARASENSLGPSLRPFSRACDRGDWHGCGMAAVVKSSLKQDPRPTAAKAFPMAMSGCRNGNGGACVYVGDWAAKAGDRITAAVHYRTACEMNLEAVGAGAIDEYACRKAIEFGETAQELRTKAKPETPHPEFKRVHGEKYIQPSPEEVRGICKLRIPRVTARFVLCLSEEGVPKKILFPEFSGAREWDRKLFETMRTWRYAPLIGESGRPEPVCTGVTFILEPKC